MLDYFWPTRCAGCDTLGEGWLCSQCVPGPPRCHDEGPEGIRRCFALTTYDQPLGRALRRAKFSPSRGLAKRLGVLLGSRVAGHLPPPDHLVAAPSNAWSRFRRGFSTASVLAHEVSRILEVPSEPLLTLSLGRRQATLDLGGRRRNLRGRLRCDKEVSGHVWLVDDVLTTGATAAACARELLGSGASQVSLVILCEVSQLSSA